MTDAKKEMLRLIKISKDHLKTCKKMIADYLKGYEKLKKQFDPYGDNTNFRSERDRLLIEIGGFYTQLLETKEELKNRQAHFKTMQ